MPAVKSPEKNACQRDWAAAAQLARHGSLGRPRPRKPGSASHACPEMLAFVLGSGRPRSSLKVDCSVKGSPQSWIVAPCDVLFENGYSPRILERDDRLADFAACAAKEARRRWPPLQPERVDFIGHGKCSRLVFGIAGDGKTQEE